MSQPPVLIYLKAYGFLLLTLILLSAWYTYYPHTCISFLFGVFFTPTVAAAGILLYIKRLPKTTEPNSSINIQLSKVEPPLVNRQERFRTVPSAPVNLQEPQEIRLNNIEPSLQKPPCRFHAFEMQSKISSATELSLPNIRRDSAREPTNPANKFKDQQLRLTKQSSLRDIVLGKKRSMQSPIMKIGHREFKSELDELITLFKFISYAEKIYGQGFKGLPIKQYAAKEDNKCQLKSLSDDDLLFLTRKFNRGFNSEEAFAISDLNKLKENLSFVGELHINCCYAVEKVSISKIETLKLEYEEQYLTMKNDKKDHVGAYEEAKQDFANLKKEQEEQEETLATILREYESKCQNREDSEILLKYEMKARLAKLQLDSLKNRVLEADDKLNESKKSLDEENDKISVFIQIWETKKLTVCQNTFKSLIATLQEKMDNAEKILSVLINPVDNERKIAPKNLVHEKTEVLMEVEVEEDSISIAEEMMVSGSSVQVSYQKKEGKRKRFFKAIKQGAHKLMHKNEIPENQENQSYLSNSLSISAANSSNSSIKQTFVDMRGKLDFYNGKYLQQVKKYEEEVGKSKDILSLMKQIIENQDSYMKEKKKFLFFEPTYLKGEVIMNYLKALKGSICTTKEINCKLFEKICAIEKRLSDSVSYLQHQAEDNDFVTQKALKRVSQFIRRQESSATQEPSFKQSVKKMFHRSDYEAKPHILGASAKLPSEQDLDLGFFEDKESIFKSLEESVALRKQIIKTFREKSLLAKKDTIIAVLQCYMKQKEELSALVNKVEKINNCIEQDKEVISALAVVDKQIGKTEECKNLEVSVSSLNLNQTSPDLTLEKVPSQLLLRSLSNEVVLSKNSSSIDDEPSNDPQDISWLNKMLTFFFQEWPDSPIFKEKMMKGVFKLMNRRKRRFLQQIQVKDFIMDHKAPEIRKITVMNADKTEFVCDFEIAHKGGVFVEIETKLEPEGFLNTLAKDYCVSVRARVLVKRFVAKMRLCWKLPEHGSSWYPLEKFQKYSDINRISFIGEPAMDINVEPLVGSGLINVGVFPKVESLLRKLIAKKLRKITYPNHKVIKFPLHQIPPATH